VAIRIEERFVVDAPVGPVWDFLVDPRRVVECVPGGELGEVVDARTFHGAVRVVVGPLALAYRGRVRLAEVDLAARRVKIVGEARERAGPGSARLTLESGLTALPGGATEVVAQLRLDVEGRIVELGRGVLELLAHVVFQDFAACVAARVEAEQAGRVSPGAAAAARREPLRVVPLLLRALRAWLSGARRPPAGGPPP